MISAMWGTVFDVGGKKKEILKIEEEMARPGFWDDNRRASERSQELSELKRETARMGAMQAEADTLTGLIVLAAESAEDHEMSREIAVRMGALQKEVKQL